ncbi:MAG TPA: polymer-forming cytoskeletal protein [Gemmatimonadaceae bacterium]|nr:polymer-forming cytoskeletal protein [Gemmatimonadaceae bacterium]
MSSRKSHAVADPSATGYSVFDAQTTVEGDLETDGTLRVDGRLRGDVRRADIVVVAVGASIVGNISAREVIVGGSVEGNISAQRVELQHTGAVTGDVEAPAILILEGGRIQGRLTIHPNATGQRIATDDAAPPRPRLHAADGR